jgi:polyvinyl alcohol dehydrogenase (cytochrome)
MREERGRRPGRRLAVVLVMTVLVAWGSPAMAGSVWPTYHGDAARTGNDTTEPALLPIAQTWSTAMDGAVYGQPVVFAGRVFAATENDTVYGLDAHDGHVLWSAHVGTPVTGIRGLAGGCGNIDPLGITSTPVVDTTTARVFVVAERHDATGFHHQLFGINAYSGGIELSVNVDPTSDQNEVIRLQQRAGLALGNGRVYIGFGGLYGDCTPYHGWLVSTDENGGGKISFDVAPHTTQGAIWATSGPAIDTAGNVYVATGNPNPVPSTGDYGESVIKLGPSLNVLGAFTSSNASDDLDLGSVGPSLLPGNRLFQTGKQHQGYILSTANLSTPIATIPTVCSGDADGGNAYSPTLNFIFVPCRGTPITAVNLGNNQIQWRNFAANGPPILAGGVLWAVNWISGTLIAVNPATGVTAATLAVGRQLPTFTSPSAALGLILVGTTSGVTAFAGPSGPPPPAPLPPGCVPQPNHSGYWMAARDGGIFTFGGAPFCGSTGNLILNQPVVGMTGTPGPGYWLAARDGGVFSFNVPFLGSMGGTHLNQPVVGIAATITDHGYWLVASDGGIFTFGDAVFHGSTGSLHLNAPIVGMAPTPSGHGYWLVASDGGIFTFGDAVFRGSTGGQRLNRPIVGMAATASGQGYWLVASDGGIFTFGDALFHGSMGGIHLNRPVVAMAAAPTGGYWLVASDGGIFTFGGAPFEGSLGGQHLNQPVVGISHD